ncbi:MAG TPA: hypothetical protein VE986_05595 [Hyphomicrobiales bacterium]|nr:hypothetical protein [Hyphomicrobiales bacterium]
MALWRASAENAQIEQSSHEFNIALAATQEKLQDAIQRLTENTARLQYAEAKQREAAAAELAARKLRDAAEAKMTELRGKLAAAENKLKLAEAKLSEEPGPGRAAQGALLTAENEARISKAKLTSEMPRKKVADTTNKSPGQSGGIGKTTFTAVKTGAAKTKHALKTAKAQKAATRQTYKFNRPAHYMGRKRPSSWTWLTKLIRRLDTALVRLSPPARLPPGGKQLRHASTIGRNSIASVAN